MPCRVCLQHERHRVLQGVGRVILADSLCLKACIASQDCSATARVCFVLASCMQMAGVPLDVQEHVSKLLAEASDGDRLVATVHKALAFLESRDTM